MGWFDEQIEYRKQRERALLSDSFENLARAVTGKKTRSFLQDQADVSDAVSALLRHMGVKEKEVPPTVRGLRDRLDYLLSSTGILYREVILPKGWHRDGMGPLIATLRESGAVVAVLPSAMGGYEYMDPATGNRVRLSGKSAAGISEEALCFYRPLPSRPLNLRDLLRYMLSCLTTWDLVSFGIASLAIVLLGLLTPRLNRILTGPVLATGSTQLLAAAISFLFFSTLSVMLLSIIRSMLLSRIRSKLTIQVNAATMMRILSLPATFFRKYSAGELNQYIGYMASLCETLVDSLFSTAVTGVFSLVYLAQIFNFAPGLVWPSLLMTLLTLGVSMLSAILQMRIDKEKMTCTARERGLVFSLITGIQKIRLSGAENRAFSRWAQRYVKGAEMTYNPPAILRLSAVLTTGISLIGTGVMYSIAVQTHVSVADYFAFSASYGYISSAFSALAAMALSAASIRPIIDLVKPLLAAEPENADNKETLTRLSGAIELSHVTFGYDPESKPLFEDFSLKINPREYVAIVGRSGCGKTTLVRLLLGFEKPSRGAISYDRKDLQHLDLHSLRRQIGAVMQDGKLFSGSIYENITISAPTIPMDAVWEAAEIAGIAEDIREMPMGMHTVLQEGGGTISGGQRQRLLIARAIAPKPKILIFDEATSALDNITQRKVSEALDSMKCTRLVIAHRLSTIRRCSRILVLDGGKIVEDGTYDALIAQGGLFASLVASQRLDI